MPHPWQLQGQVGWGIEQPDVAQGFGPMVGVLEQIIFEALSNLNIM